MVEDTRPPGEVGTNGGLSCIPKVALDMVADNGIFVVGSHHLAV